jgi:hypothetical protein
VAGFSEISVSIFNAFIGNEDGLVSYKPDTATIEQMGQLAQVHDAIHRAVPEGL